VFGRLTVIKEAGKTKGRITWLCKCECRAEVEVLGKYLTARSSTSCGCDKENTSSNPAYVCWKSMKARCSDPGRKDHKRYGGLGITVCERWQNSFKDFLEDVGDRPSLNHSLDRIESTLGYQPGNIRWSTAKEQSRNTKTNRLLTYDGRTQCLAAWAEELGLKQATISTRLNRCWSVERALGTKTA
jgi:hypothetical protein